MKRVAFWTSLAALVTASRLLHAHLLWPDEDYHLAAAIQILHGKIPYAGFWYDKPPLSALFYVLFGARTGVTLRLADAAFVCCCCALAFQFARRLWSNREGYWAAGLLGFFLIFYLPAGVIPLEPDTLLLAPELLAVYWAWSRKPFWAGLAAGIAFQLTPKGVFVLAAAAAFAPSEMLLLLAGFAVPSALVVGVLGALGALPGYFEQVWRWGFLYAGAPGASGRGAALSVLNWIGFHAALLIGAICYWLHGRDKLRGKFAIWTILSLASALIVALVAPRYFMMLLGALAIPAARGLAGARGQWKALAAIALLIPAVRFGPRYFNLETWQDTAMDRESRSVAAWISARAKPGDTIFVWGYRPDIVAYTRLPVVGVIWDSQPATGVPASRHLFDATTVSEDWARSNRQTLARTSPAFLVDGLSLYNPRLDIHRYPELAQWLSRYCPMTRIGGTVVYSVCAGSLPDR